MSIHGCKEDTAQSLAIDFIKSYLFAFGITGRHLNVLLSLRMRDFEACVPRIPIIWPRLCPYFSRLPEGLHFCCLSKPFPWDSLHPLCPSTPWTSSFCFLGHYIIFSWYYFRSMTNILHIHGSLPGIMLTLYLTGIAPSFQWPQRETDNSECSATYRLGRGRGQNKQTHLYFLLIWLLVYKVDVMDLRVTEVIDARMGSREHTMIHLCTSKPHCPDFVVVTELHLSSHQHSLSIQESFLDTLSPFLLWPSPLFFQKLGSNWPWWDDSGRQERATSASLTSPSPLVMTDKTDLSIYIEVSGLGSDNGNLQELIILQYSWPKKETHRPSILSRHLYS